MPYLLAILSAVFYGAADFTGGIVTRRVSAIPVVLISQASGLVLVALALPLLPTAAPRAADLWWSASYYQLYRLVSDVGPELGYFGTR